MTDGLCQCGCGQPAPIAKRTVTSRGRIKGQPVRYIVGHNARGMNRSKPWKTDRYRLEDRGFKSECWVWQMKKTREGYGFLGSAGKNWLAHRWYYTQARGPIPAGLQLDHLCKQRDCVNPDHLEPVTPLENSRRGSFTKLSLEQAREIEHLAATAGLSSYKIASMFGVSRQTVDLIRKNGAEGPRRPDR